MPIRSRLLLILTGLLVAIVLPACSRPESVEAGVDYYTCSMHPSVRSQRSHDKCPLCAMDLVPVPKNPATMARGENLPVTPSRDTPLPVLAEFSIPLKRQQLIGVTYAAVTRQAVEARIQVSGTVESQKQLRRDTVSRVNGYVHELHVFAAGDRVEKGQLLAEIESADFTAAQKEFIHALETADQSAAASSREELRQWQVSPEEIRAIEESRKPQPCLRVVAPMNGVIEAFTVNQGQRVSAGERLFEVVDLSAVWVWAELYQDDLARMAHEAFVRITVPGQTGQPFTGKIAIFDHHLDETKRTARMGVSVDNPDLILYPNMHVTVDVPLEHRAGLAIPAAAVLPTGKHEVVFVDKGEGRLEPRFVELGGRYGDFYFITKGLSEGDRVVTSANFLIDAEAKLQGAIKAW